MVSLFALSAQPGAFLSALFSHSCAHFAQTGTTKIAATPFFSNRCAHLQKTMGMEYRRSGKLRSLFRSLSKERIPSPLISIGCSLFAKNAGVYPNYFQFGNSSSRHPGRPSFLKYGLSRVLSRGGLTPLFRPRPAHTDRPATSLITDFWSLITGFPA